jgi:hypothetical protein
VLLGGVTAYAYVPRGGGEMLASSIPQTAPARAKARIYFFDLFDPDWMFKNLDELYTALTFHPVESIGTGFNVETHGPWIRTHYTELPLFKQVFSKERPSRGMLVVYHAPDRDAKEIQAACFYKNGVFAFADRSWRERAAGRETFRPEDAAEQAKAVLAFAGRYYKDCLGYSGKMMMMMHVVNLAGRAKEATGEQRPLPYHSDFCATVHPTAEELGTGAPAELLCDQLLKHF